MRRDSIWLFGAVVLCVVGAGQGVVFAQTALSFEDRVACHERVEDVYWSHRIWPEQNPGSKPHREKVMSREQVAAKVERAILHEAALAQVFGETLNPQRIQAELDRIGRSTRDPELLRDVFDALDNDPYLVAECFVRPRLAERRVKQRFAWDPEIHREVRERAEAELAGAVSVGDLEGGTAQITEMHLIRDEDGSVEPNKAGTEPELRLTPEEWDQMVGRLAGRFPPERKHLGHESVLRDPADTLKSEVGQGFSPLHEKTDHFTAVAVLAMDDDSFRLATASWSKTAFGRWLERTSDQLEAVMSLPGEFTLPALPTSFICQDDTWEETLVTDGHVPTARWYHTAVWTGSEMIIWGGNVGGLTNTGGRYDPAADTWTPTSITGAPPRRSHHTAVWTGAEMIVWGGHLDDPDESTGGRYNPVTNTWMATTTSNAPTSRGYHTAVWTGNEMIVWGGYDGSHPYDYTNTGGRYDPTADTWTTTETAGAPTGRASHVAVWTGRVMIAWGGHSDYDWTSLNTGGRYDPDTDSWIPTSNFLAPRDRTFHTAVWTGTEFIVWGGWSRVEGAHELLDTGGRYCPRTNRWVATSTTGAPSPRIAHSAVWTEGEMVVWGGNIYPDTNSGGRYDPARDLWTATSTNGAPRPRYAHSTVWTGEEMIVWGGADGSLLFNDGGRYDHVDDIWLATSTTDAPTARSSHTAVWTGTEMIIWGGSGSWILGGRYEPATNTWLPTSTVRAPSERSNHTSVWTGVEMVVWGGYGSGSLKTGGRYDPATDTWKETTTMNAPTNRKNHTAVWTGTAMLVWGGIRYQGVYWDTGGRYDPASDDWTPTSINHAPTARQEHTAVWTGTEMIVWGGEGGSGSMNTGGRYNPTTDTWKTTTTFDAPIPRRYHRAVWTGDKMIVWGGWNGIGQKTGGLYDPMTDSWMATTTSGAPTGRYIHTAIWTGHQMIVWGGTISQPSGGRYYPATDSWTATTASGAPTYRSGHSAVWTDSKMIIWGGYSDPYLLNTGGLYCASGVNDLVPPTDPTIDSTDPLPSSWSPDDTIEVSWSGAFDDDVGLAGYSVLFDHVVDTIPDDLLEVEHNLDPHSVLSEPLADGDDWYFHLTTCDLAGNCSSGVHAGPFWIDATPPSAPGTVTSPSHGGGTSVETTVDVEWEAATDTTSSVDGYSFDFNNDSSWICETTKDVEEGITSATSTPLALGSWFFHICAVDHADNWGPVASGGPYVIAEALIFADGFEGGDTSSWSETIEEP